MALRRHLIILAALTILPLLGFTTWIVLEVHREDRARAERALTETARALSLAVEREVTSMASALESLATSKALDAGDLKAFYEQAAALGAMQQEWTTLVLTDSAGATLLDLRRPFGTRLPDLRAEIGDVAQVVAARRPSIGESFGGEGGTRLFAIRVPVARGGAVRYALAGIVPTSELRDVLLEQRLPSDWIGTILDRQRASSSRGRGTSSSSSDSRPPSGSWRPAPAPARAGTADSRRKARTRTPRSAARRRPASRSPWARPRTPSTRRCGARSGASPAPARSCSSSAWASR